MTRVADRRVAALAPLLAVRHANPADEREVRSLCLLDAALAAIPGVFDADAGPIHVTASAVVIGASGVVLLRHKRLGIWVQPGGHLEPGEDPAAAGLREATEETGLVLAHPASGPDLVHVDVHDGGRGHVHLDLRWLLLGDGTPAPPADESPDVRWFGWAAALAMADPGLRGGLRVLRERFVRREPGA